MELIDVSYESGEVFIRNADVISAPMRLHRDEALSLVIGLQLMEQVADSDERVALADLRAKILAGATEALETASSRIAVVPEQEIAIGTTVAEALSRQRRLLIEYFVPSRDEVTEREIDPIAITTIDGERYLRAWCRSAEGLRHFRLDRIQSAKIVDRPAAPPQNLPADLEAAFIPPAGALTARLRVGRGGRWLIDFLNATGHADSEEHAEVEIAVGDLDRILALVRQHGDAVEIIEPAHLRTAVRESALAALNLYS